MMEKLHDIYLGVPYSHPDKKVREKRFYEVTKMAGWIMKKGYTVLSPITHGHPIALVTKRMPTNYEFWKNMCECQMNSCKVISCYAIDGWASSEGWQNEFKYARNILKRPVMVFRNKLEFKNEIDKKLEEFYNGEK